MHIEDWNRKFLSQFDPKTYVELLKKAQVQSAMVYANSHLGYCYWPARIGHVHRGIGDKDVLGEIIDLCHKGEIDVILYYSLIFNNWAYEHNAVWRMEDMDGKASRETPGRNRYGVCCPNSVGYRDFVKLQIGELCSKYDFEGLFFDMTFWPSVCYCQACRERFSKEIGGKMPKIINWQDSRWITFQRKREEWLVEFATFATKTAKTYKPNITVEHNSATLVQNWKLGTTLDLVKQNDYLGGDFYGSFLNQSFVCKLYSSLTPNKPFEFMTSRCYPNIKDHTTMKSRERLKLHTCLALAHNGAFLFIDAVDPIGSFNKKVYETMGEVFRQTKHYEPYLGGELCEDVAVFFSLSSKMDFADNAMQVKDSFLKEPHLDAALGAARVLKENHVPFSIISKSNLVDTSPYQVLVLPNVLMLDQEEMEAIKRFVAGGGSLYVSGYTDPDFLSDVVGVAYEGETKETVTYIAPTTKGQFLMPDIDANYPLTISGTQIRARSLGQGEVMATITLPYTDPADGAKFVSIHSNPPGMVTDYPAMVYSSYGKGKVIWVSTPLEKEDKELHKSIFAQIIRTLAVNSFSFEADAAAAVEVTVFHQLDRKRYVINLINEQEQLPPIPVADIKVRVRTDGRQALRALLLPEEKRVPFETKGNYTQITVPTLRIFQMLMLDYE